MPSPELGYEHATARVHHASWRRGSHTCPCADGPPDTFSIAQNAHEADARTGAILNSIDPNLSPFKSHGGKLIQYVGWGDSAISPENDINYYIAFQRPLCPYPQIAKYKGSGSTTSAASFACVKPDHDD